MTQTPLRQMISKSEAAKAIGKSTRTLDRMIEEGIFPAGVPSRGRPVWVKSEVADWQQAQIDKRDKETAERLAANRDQEAA